MDILASSPSVLCPGYEALNRCYRENEHSAAGRLLNSFSLSFDQRRKAEVRARDLISHMRSRSKGGQSLDTLLAEYKLTSREGLALMCLAEALLRVPDTATIDDLIADKLRQAEWHSHAGVQKSLAVNTSAIGMGMARNFVYPDSLDNASIFQRLLNQLGAPVVRIVVRRMMRSIGHQFVAGETIERALQRYEGSKYRFSYDMLGEAAITQQDADKYFRSYDEAIGSISQHTTENDLHARPGISVKLSALHPRYEYSQQDRVLAELTDKLLLLARHAADANIGLTVDAEEAERLELSLEIIRRVAEDKATSDWEGLGLVVQAYSKRALPELDWLTGVCAQTKRRMQVRLAKGGYWDTEIKISQVSGHIGYPIFTRKATTDVSYMACAHRLLSASDSIYPMFATHNALTVSTILAMTGKTDRFEFQRLHGMGSGLYDQVLDQGNGELNCRVYAPVGKHNDLMPYLVRRLIENGASSSFVNKMVDHEISIDDLVADPLSRVQMTDGTPHPKIPLPTQMFGPNRRNSMGLDLTDSTILGELSVNMRKHAETLWQGHPIIGGQAFVSDERDVLDPSNTRRKVGTTTDAAKKDALKAIELAHAAYEEWNATSVSERAACLQRAADILEDRLPQFMAMLVREAGKTIPDTIAELREAIDFCRYYAQRAIEDLTAAQDLGGPTGESNEYSYHGRGVFVCISPWNFPVAIFTGQISAALVAGNTVVAKPAEQTTLVATVMTQVLHEAGVPKSVLHLVTGLGETIGEVLCMDERVTGVAFTGSTETALRINRLLATRSAFIPKLIAETGGQNALIADSSALPEQVIMDTISSAFHTAGQRCSALRLLFLQEEVADLMVEKLVGAMRELVVGNPSDLRSDVGPVIDKEAYDALVNHFQKTAKTAKLLHKCSTDNTTEHGHFFAPCAFEISIDELPEQEVFGPFLHVVRYRKEDLDSVLTKINATKYGLTLGIHSRIEDTVRRVRSKARAGNIYINRDIIGAQVGVQPFGGERRSGTGPKAGGPNYLFSFCTERSVAENTTASGGDPELVSLSEDVD